MDLDVIKQILMESCDYWVIAKKNYINRRGTMERMKDQIIFVSFPQEIPRSLAYDEIKLSHIELFNKIRLDMNIFLNEPYAPFQISVNYYDVWKAFPVKVNPRKFLVECLLTKTQGDIWEYEEIYKKLAEEEQSQNQTV